MFHQCKMKIISWNIRGLNGAHKQEVIRNMIREQRPNILLIQEIKMKKESLVKITFSNIMSGEALDSEGASRGLLTLFNNKQFRFTTLYSDGNILFCKVFHMYSNDIWFLLNVYAPNSKRERKNYWSKVYDMVQTSNIKKCIIMEDFNSPQQMRRRWEVWHMTRKGNWTSLIL